LRACRAASARGTKGASQVSQLWGAKVMDDAIARAERAKKGTPFLSTEQAAFYLGLSPRKLQEMRAAGDGPVHRRHCRYVRYHIDDLESWSRQSGRSHHG
jgi:hypothetical protein